MEYRSREKKQLALCVVIIVIALLLSGIGSLPNWLKYERVFEFVYDPIFDMEVSQSHDELVSKAPTVREWIDFSTTTVALILFALYATKLFKKLNQKAVVTVVFGLLLISPVMLPLDIFVDMNYDEMHVIKVSCAALLVSCIYTVVIARNEIKRFNKKLWIWIAAILVFAMDYSILAETIYTVKNCYEETRIYAIAYAADFAATIALQIALLVFAIRERTQDFIKENLDTETEQL